MLIMVYNVVIYVMIRKTLASPASPYSADPVKSKLLWRLTLYIWVFLFIRIWGVINRLQNFADRDHPSFTLYMLTSLFSPLQGMFNAIVYGFNQRLMLEYKKRFAACGLALRKCSCCLPPAAGASIRRTSSLVANPTGPEVG